MMPGAGIRHRAWLKTAHPVAAQDAHRQQIIDWINAAGGTTTAFDVTTKGILHAVFEVPTLAPRAALLSTCC